MDREALIAMLLQKLNTHSPHTGVPDEDAQLLGPEGLLETPIRRSYFVEVEEKTSELARRPIDLDIERLCDRDQSPASNVHRLADYIEKRVEED